MIRILLDWMATGFYVDCFHYFFSMLLFNDLHNRYFPRIFSNTNACIVTKLCIVLPASDRYAVADKNKMTKS